MLQHFTRPPLQTFSTSTLLCKSRNDDADGLFRPATPRRRLRGRRQIRSPGPKPNRGTSVEPPSAKPSLPYAAVNEIRKERKEEIKSGCNQAGRSDQGCSSCPSLPSAPFGPYGKNIKSGYKAQRRCSRSIPPFPVFLPDSFVERRCELLSSRRARAEADIVKRWTKELSGGNRHGRPDP